MNIQKYQEVKYKKYFNKLGKVVNVVGLTGESSGPDATLGDICRIYTDNLKTSYIVAEVVGFRDNKTLLMPYEEINGIGSGCVVENLGHSLSITVGDELLGKTLDGLGRPIDGELLNTGKRMNGISQLANFINTYGVNALVSSEIDKNIKYLAKKNPNIRRGIKFASLDTDEKIKGSIKKKVNKIKFAKKANPDFIEFDINTLPNEILDNKRAEGMLIISSVINTDAKLNKAKVYTDSFVLGRRYLEEAEE